MLIPIICDFLLSSFKTKKPEMIFPSVKNNDVLIADRYVSRRIWQPWGIGGNLRLFNRKNSDLNYQQLQSCIFEESVEQWF